VCETGWVVERVEFVSIGIGKVECGVSTVVRSGCVVAEV
jgi:hypothetical protein